MEALVDVRVQMNNVGDDDDGGRLELDAGTPAFRADGARYDHP